jgi:multiple antibiotic resistance protein
MALLNLVIILFLIMDPLGNISSFLHMLEGIPVKKRRMIILREMLIALAAMVLFNFIGELIFDVLKVSHTTLKLASGVILFLVGVKILFPNQDSVRANLPSGEPFITPLAIPLIAGPSLLATIMLFAHLEPSHWVVLAAILIAWALAVIVLLSGTFLKRILTVNGLMACERLMGMVLILLAIQRFLEGIKEFIKTC